MVRSITPPEDHGQVCHVFHAAIELIGRRWTGVILYALSRGPQRFSDFSEAIPDISDRLLSERLKALEDAGVVVREVSAGRPVQVSYRLTAKGEALQPIMEMIGAWATQWAEVPASPTQEGR